MQKVLGIPPRSGIYKIENVITKQSYIGSASVMQKRCNAHKSLLDNNKHTNIKLQRSYCKYGFSSFTFSVIKFCDIQELLIMEQSCIDLHKPYFNIRPVCQTSRGVKLSIETRKRMSIAKKGTPLNFAQKAAIGKIHNSRKGIPVTGKTKDSLKLGPLSRIGKPVSTETRNKIAATKIGKKFNILTRKYE